jgi:hypothetical protein
VQNFKRFSTGQKPGYSVPAVLGHEESQEFLDREDLPAAAWVESLKNHEFRCPECGGRGKVAVKNADESIPAAALFLNVTTAGNLALTTLNGQGVTIPLPVGVFTLPIAVSAVPSSGTTIMGTIVALW